MKLNYKFLAALITATAAFATAGYAADRHPKSKSNSLSRLPPGLDWADTNKDGQLSNDEFKRASQILQDKIKDTKNKLSKSTRK